MKPGSCSTFPLLVCPYDQLSLTKSADKELACPRGHCYPIRNGIPRLVAGNTYADAFGEQWHRYRVTQLDSHTGTSLSKVRLRRCLGEELWSRLQEDPPLQVLETGCGAGRFTEILLQLAGASVTSTDLSSAVEPNQLNCPQSDRHRILQCDINRLPFVAEQYDIVLCLGVVQHTKNPEMTMLDLYKQVKPGGWLVMDHYTHTLSGYTKVTAGLLRPILKRLPASKGLTATTYLTRSFFPLHRAVKNQPLLQMLLSRVSPLLTYYHAFPELSDQLQYEWAELDTHDSLTDYYKHLRSASAIRRTLMSLGAREVQVVRGGNGVEARCQKAAGD